MEKAIDGWTPWLGDGSGGGRSGGSCKAVVRFRMAAPITSLNTTDIGERGSGGGCGVDLACAPGLVESCGGGGGGFGGSGGGSFGSGGSGGGSAGSDGSDGGGGTGLVGSTG